MIKISKKFNVLVHIPHVSTAIPDDLLEKTKMASTDLFYYATKMADIGADRIVKHNDDFNYLQAEYTRLYCDVERYKDDTKEEMSKYGMGVVYTHTYDRKQIIDYDKKNVDRIIKSYYDPYHQRLTDLSKSLLQKDNWVLLIDCHTFSDEMASYFRCGPFPDVCIGTVEKYSDNEEYQKLIIQLIDEYKSRGLSVERNNPYKGAIVPNDLSDDELTRLYSVMIEINKRVISEDVGIEIQFEL